ncbi:MAG: type IV pilin protein [Gammaproteobacteria bacterium]
MKKTSGFSLLELLIVLTIITILGALSVPLYSQHFIHANRLEAELYLIKLAGKLEQYHIVNNTFQGADLNTLGFSETIVANQYRLAIVTNTESTFSLQAQPLDTQAEKDVLCGTLGLNSLGEKDFTGTGTLKECWQ